MTAPILIVGATGAVGRGVVAAAVAAGRGVIASARNPHRLRRLREAWPDADIRVLPGSIATDARAALLAEAVRALGRPLAGVVVAVRGDVRRGRLVERPETDLSRTLERNLHPHLFAARHLVPLLTAHGRGGGYVLLGGPGAEQPWAGYGTWSISAAALQMLARVLHEEARSHEVRVQLLQVSRPVRGGVPAHAACPEWPSADAIGRRVLSLIDRVDPADASSSVIQYPARDAPPEPSAATRTAPVAVAHGAAHAVPPAPRCQADVRQWLHGLLSPRTPQE